MTPSIVIQISFSPGSLALNMSQEHNSHRPLYYNVVCLTILQYSKESQWLYLKKY